MTNSFRYAVNVTPKAGGDSQSFTNIASGFGVGIGYAF